MGAVYSLYTQSFPPKSQFSVNDIPDLTGRITIVTGGNTGIGKETAKVSQKLHTLFHQKKERSKTGHAQALLAQNAKVYIAGRSQEKVEAAIKDLKEQTGNEAIFLKVDLADLRSVKAGAEEFLKSV
ncbi:hypothetical protein H0H81_003248 [Sphagnurus paluster]|uniref:Uncharacterized protein n=1 Tax=Sphagnurus paluster TaxID=117069 RepID=A0A9P7GSX8_9AGAR|nr:hypothetical protein H0H81_003248 [Sphagnurus paluster]